MWPNEHPQGALNPNCPSSTTSLIMFAMTSIRASNQHRTAPVLLNGTKKRYGNSSSSRNTNTCRHGKNSRQEHQTP
eukprot:CAMPEP_0202913876 /NCGR_PEP_ID=MMETSP1392-20130828/61689_1 /ASSEMBLY_ACC=CAM_ASM_000868 /TAXON_ID=225041 /ORGANISM="Chlamydomonas chlamydogama, Strain SAG 11-48b" /LENGTH=75 /DNA_ID=CAMNT_0049605313 /DNA_START=199 /DNA_END=422 /DNA_ORIENTATION=+